VVEAGTSLALRCRVVDATPAELVDLSETGALLITWNPADQNWLGMSGRGSRLRIIGHLPDSGGRPSKRRQVDAILRSISQAGLIRCVVAESMPVENQSSAEESSPWDRLNRLLRPEVSDIGIVFVFAIVSGVLALATPIAVESLVNTVAFGRLVQPIFVLTLIVMCVLAFAAAIRALQKYVVEIIQQRLFARVATDLAWRLPRVQAAARDLQNVSEMVNRFLDIVTVQKATSQLLLDGIAVVLGTLIGMAVLAFYHPWLLAMDAALLALMVLAVTVLGRGAVATSIAESKCKYKVAGWLDELARCSLAFKHEGGCEFALQRADQLTRDYLISRQQHFRILMRQVTFMLGLQALASTALLGLGGWLVMAGQLTLGQLVAAELIVTAIVSSFAKMGKLLDSFYDLMASVDKLGTLFDLSIERPIGLLCLPSVRPVEIAVNGVSYSNDDERRGVDELTLHINSGERVAITGPDYGGGSTFLDLLFGLRQPTAGYLTLDEIDPRDVRPDVLRRRVALVRDIEVFHGTIAENVHLDRPDVTMQQVREALLQAELLDDVLRLPEGLETHITRETRLLTGVQAVRLMLARAFVARPGLLLIDGLLDRLSDQEATALVASLCDRSNPWTLVVVTGRKSVADACDRAVHLAADGRN
jgi:ABC-type bacteriocin/lantibiotic exporter with double-glycine peptidase domain